MKKNLLRSLLCLALLLAVMAVGVPGVVPEVDDQVRFITSHGRERVFNVPVGIRKNGGFNAHFSISQSPSQDEIS